MLVLDKLVDDALGLVDVVSDEGGEGLAGGDGRGVAPLAVEEQVPLPSPRTTTVGTRTPIAFTERVRSLV